MMSKDKKGYVMIDGIEHKKCSTCKKPQKLDDFSNRAASKDGKAYSCKACERATSKASYKRRKRKQQTQQYYQDNKDKYLDRSKARYEENKEEILEGQKGWRKSERGKEVMSEAGKRRRDRIKEQTPGGRDYTRDEIIERDSVFGDCICQICGLPIDIAGGELELDHIVPIAAGGSDTGDNIRCAHQSCNNTRPKDGRDLLEA